jgi:hypothetical protein
MRINRRSLLAGGIGAGAIGLAPASAAQRKAGAPAPGGPSPQDLDRAAAAPVLKLDALKSPVIIESIKLLRKDKQYLVHVRSRDGAEGVSFPNPPRADYLDKILKQLVIPFFLGKDARDLENLLSMPEFKTRALADLKKIQATDDAKVVRVVSGSEEAKNLVTEQIDNPRPVWKRLGFASKQAVNDLVTAEDAKAEGVIADGK